MSLEEAIETVKSAGFAIVPAQGWIKLRDYRKDLGLKVNTISARLKRPDCPPFESDKGPTGRINYIRPHDQLTTYLLRIKQRGN